MIIIHKVFVREFPAGIAHKRKDGLILMHGTKNTLYNYWHKAYTKDGYGASKPLTKLRKEHLEECVSCYSWFTLHYAVNPTVCTDMEIRAFSEYYEIYLSHYLATDAAIIKAGGKHDKILGNVLAHISEVDYLWNITKLVIERHEIDWIRFDGGVISIKV